jgi:Zn-dependent protease/CBS domain-containing protein
MSWSIPLFKVKGIQIKVHLTFVLILIWAAYHWGVSLGQGTAGAVYGMVVITLLFACVIIHELAHSLVAMRFGVKVEGITLLPIGGISQMEEMPKKPKEELVMALAGPMTNVVIAALLLAVAIPLELHAGVSAAELERVMSSPTWPGLVSYLAMANIFLAVFNLLPAYPMDGGRVLRAFLALRMDHAKATVWAVRIGQGMAWAFGLAGALTGAWMLVIIAVFIYIGAGQEGRMVEIKDALEGLKVGQAMTRDIASLRPNAPISEAVEHILKGFQIDFPVVEEGRLVGYLTEVDLVAALKETGPETAVKQAMRTDLKAASPDEPLFDVQQSMGRQRVRSLPVTEGGHLVGLISAQDVGEAFLFMRIRPDLVGASRRAT